MPHQPAQTMSSGTNRYGYAGSTVGATGLLIDTEKTSVNTNVYMGRSVLHNLSKYIDDVLTLNGDIDEKIYNPRTTSTTLPKNKKLWIYSLKVSALTISKNLPQWRQQSQVLEKLVNIG